MGNATRRNPAFNPRNFNLAKYTVELSNGGSLQILAYNPRDARRYAQHLLRNFPNFPRIVAITWRANL